MTNRRQVLRRLAVGAAWMGVSGIAPSRVLGANDRICFGLIGAGGRGQAIFRAALRCPNTEAVAKSRTVPSRWATARPSPARWPWLPTGNSEPCGGMLRRKISSDQRPDASSANQPAASGLNCGRAMHQYMAVGSSRTEVEGSGRAGIPVTDTDSRCAETR